MYQKMFSSPLKKININKLNIYKKKHAHARVTIAPALSSLCGIFFSPDLKCFPPSNQAETENPCTSSALKNGLKE